MGQMRFMGYFAKMQVSIAVLMLVSSGVEVEGKRGCINFGHSCFGGIGKRNLDVRNAYEFFPIGGVENSVKKPGEIWNSYYLDRTPSKIPQNVFQLSRIIKQLTNNYKDTQDRKPILLSPRFHNLFNNVIN